MKVTAILAATLTAGGCVLAPEYTTTTTPTSVLESIQPKPPVPEPPAPALPLPTFPPPQPPPPEPPPPAQVRLTVYVNSYGFITPRPDQYDPNHVGVVLGFGAVGAPPAAPQSIRWEFGDGQEAYSLSSTTSHGYPLAGSWTVTVRVDWQNGQRAQSSVQVSTPQQCVLWPTPGCLP